MKVLKNFAGGLAGAIALNVLHEVVRHFNHNAPNVQLIGEEAITKMTDKAGLNSPKGNSLYLTTLTADVLSNAVYYSMIGAGKKKHLLIGGQV